MTVTISSRKGRNVVTIEPSATLQAAGIRNVGGDRIGAVVVLGADRRVIGLLSERDVVRAFAEFGADAFTKRLAQVMTLARLRPVGRPSCSALYHGADDHRQASDTSR